MSIIKSSCELQNLKSTLFFAVQTAVACSVFCFNDYLITMLVTSNRFNNGGQLLRKHLNFVTDDRCLDLVTLNQ